MVLVNLTPHVIVLRPVEGEDVSIPPSGSVARVSSTPGAVQMVPGIPVPVASPTTFGEIVGLPSSEEGTVFIVSGMVLAALAGKGRSDVFGPGTGPNDGAIRNAAGQVEAVTRLIAASA